MKNDEAWGEELPQETQDTLQALRHVPLAAVRRAFQLKPHLLRACPHPEDDRVLLYGIEYCRRCGEEMKR